MKREGGIFHEQLETLVNRGETRRLFQTLHALKKKEFESLVNQNFQVFITIFDFLHGQDRDQLELLFKTKPAGELLFSEYEKLIFDTAYYLSDAIEYSFYFRNPNLFILHQTPLGRNFPEGDIALNDQVNIHFKSLYDLLETQTELRRVIIPRNIISGKESGWFFKEYHFDYRPGYAQVKKFIYSAKRRYDTI